MKKLFLLVLLLMFILLPSVFASWWNTDWQTRYAINDWKVTSNLYSTHMVRLEHVNLASLNLACSTANDFTVVNNETNEVVSAVNIVNWDGTKNDSDVDVYFKLTEDLATGTYAGKYYIYVNNNKCPAPLNRTFHKSSFDGFEDGDYTNKPKWVTLKEPTIQSSVVKNGNYALAMIKANNSLTKYYTSSKIEVIGFYLRAENIDGQVQMRVGASNGAQIVFGIRYNNFQYFEDNWKDTGVKASNNTWYYIEVKMDYVNAKTDYYWYNEDRTKLLASALNKLGLPDLSYVEMFESYDITAYYDDVTFDKAYSFNYSLGEKQEFPCNIITKCVGQQIVQVDADCSETVVETCSGDNICNNGDCVSLIFKTENSNEFEWLKMTEEKIPMQVRDMVAYGGEIFVGGEKLSAPYYDKSFVYVSQDNGVSFVQKGDKVPAYGGVGKLFTNSQGTLFAAGKGSNVFGFYSGKWAQTCPASVCGQGAEITDVIETNDFLIASQAWPGGILKMNIYGAFAKKGYIISLFNQTKGAMFVHEIDGKIYIGGDYGILLSSVTEDFPLMPMPNWTEKKGWNQYGGIFTKETVIDMANIGNDIYVLLQNGELYTSTVNADGTNNGFKLFGKFNGLAKKLGVVNGKLYAVFWGTGMNTGNIFFQSDDDKWHWFSGLKDYEVVDVEEVNGELYLLATSSYESDSGEIFVLKKPEDLECKADNDCGQSFECKGYKCALKIGCAYANPSCDKPFNCVDNSCVLPVGKCSTDNDCTGFEFCNNEFVCKLKQEMCYTEKDCTDNYFCSNNVCLKAFCSADAECGASSWSGKDFCSKNDIFDYFKTYSCENPGTAQAKCAENSVQQLFQQCVGDEICSKGKCNLPQVIFLGKTGNGGVQVVINGVEYSLRTNNQCNKLKINATIQNLVDDQLINIGGKWFKFDKDQCKLTEVYVEITTQKMRSSSESNMQAKERDSGDEAKRDKEDRNDMNTNDKKQESNDGVNDSRHDSNDAGNDKKQDNSADKTHIIKKMRRH